MEILRGDVERDTAEKRGKIEEQVEGVEIYQQGNKREEGKYNRGSGREIS